MEWYVQKVLPCPDRVGTAGPERYGWLNEGAARARPGSGGLLFMPLLSGAYAAVQGAHARGAWLGLTLSHSKDEMSRSVMEGVAYEVRRQVALAEAMGARIEALKMVGGATASPVWPQVVADVLGLPVDLPEAREAGSRGAAILAGVGARLFRDAREGSARFHSLTSRLEPRPGQRQVYDELYAAYQEAFQGLQVAFGRLSRFQAAS